MQRLVLSNEIISLSAPVAYMKWSCIYLSSFSSSQYNEYENKIEHSLSM